MSELSRRQRWILLGASLGVGLAFLDETAVVTALRDIQRTFGATSAEVQWVMGAYLLALASLMAAAGRLADMYGRRRLFLVGAGLFGAGSIACAAAPDQVWLIVARGVQGSGGALLMPLGYANGTSAVPEQRHGWAVGIISTGATVFLALGPLIGGAITENPGFRYPRTVLRVPSEGHGIHPTQKPVALFEYLIRTYTNPGDLVLDTFMGSGTTAVACINTNRNFVGFERDPGFFRMAEKRINTHRQTKTSPL